MMLLEKKIGHTSEVPLLVVKLGNEAVRMPEKFLHPDERKRGTAVNSSAAASSHSVERKTTPFPFAGRRTEDTFSFYYYY